MCANKMKKHATEDDDPFRNLNEWQDHRYDPGYFTGGKIHPLLKARRPNKYGYVLIQLLWVCWSLHSSGAGMRPFFRWP